MLHLRQLVLGNTLLEIVKKVAAAGAREHTSRDRKEAVLIGSTNARKLLKQSLLSGVYE